MFDKLEGHIKEALMSLEASDLNHCMKLAKHFDHMGISPRISGSALKGLADSGIVERLYQQT